ncbi:MAG TPA: hypothetical protein VH186_22985 [Chloroflexia bacterium]|nr:hypothetical protein [Chloroflexia bacterium]
MSEMNQSTHHNPMDGGQYTDWARQLVEGLVEAERKWMELAAQQNELVFNAIREGIEAYRSAPNPALGDWARQGLENFLEAQRKWTENFTQQRTQFFNMETQPADIDNIPEVGATATPSASQFAGFTSQPLEMMADARRRWLDFAARQNAQVVAGVKKALNIEEGTSAASYVDWTQQAVNNYVEVQKRWLDLFTQLPFQGQRRG